MNLKSSAIRFRNNQTQKNNSLLKPHALKVNHAMILIACCSYFFGTLQLFVSIILKPHAFGQKYTIMHSKHNPTEDYRMKTYGD